MTVEELLRKIYRRLCWCSFWLFIIAVNSCDLVSR
nr:hypothetical protein HHOCTOMJ_HHOCTOMJ_CDS_0003 [Microvirus sp.]